MAAHGFQPWWPYEKLAVRGYVEVLRHYRGIVQIRNELRDIEVDGDGWRIVKDSPVMFRRSANQAAFPKPLRDGRLDDLRPFFTGDDSTSNVGVRTGVAADTLLVPSSITPSSAAVRTLPARRRRNEDT